MRAPELTLLADVPGAVSETLTRTDIPAGESYEHEFFDAAGNVIRRDVRILVKSFAIGADTGLPGA